MPLTIEWSEVEIRTLVDKRRRWNGDYYRIFGRSKVGFWNEVAEKVKEETGISFIRIQCKEKFKNMIKKCKVSKEICIIYINKKKYIYNNLIFLVVSSVRRR